MNIDLVSYTLANLISSGSFYIDSLGFSTWIIVSSVCEGCFLPFRAGCLLFFLPYPQIRTFSTMLNRHFASDLRGKSFTKKYDVGCGSS